MRKPTSSTPLRQVRIARTISQAALADIVGVSQQTQSKFESGRLTPSSDMQQRYAAVLGASRAELFPPPAQEARAS